MDGTSLSDESILKQQDDIQKGVAENQFLIGDKEKCICLMPEYENNPLKGFAEGIKYLDEEYAGLRRVRGDGNCFYRGFLFAYLENMISHLQDWGETELSRVTSVIQGSKDALVALGYSEVAIESFWEEFVEVLQKLPEQTNDQLEEMFREEGGSAEYLVWYCRLLAAGHIKSNAERFLPFIENPDVNSFCSSEVEPMGKECEQVQILGLTEALGCAVHIEYLDGRGPMITGDSEAASLNAVTLPENLPVRATLLYRPGHYDILYKH
eukprot:CAMPEP_0113943978 /NCGR_PEP_ID=MMETSP1339-20121228/30146_1 /TAXON_ID=94617 /ORGANISM="Fibrocapsa japonica" /LENGTH=266 /DNA_ID=CAMNT_0000949003 /DNA_START=111 /DNA_END=911 /DNA_ORIENTATION=+ /assembly_acc=CAM_ASM_000762